MAADDEDEDDDMVFGSGRVAAGVGSEAPSDWSVPKFGEGNPLLPPTPSTVNEKGVKIITPATISCYPMLRLHQQVYAVEQNIDKEQGLSIRNENRYWGWRNALRAYVACLYQFYKGETGFDTMIYPPSDKDMLEKLEQLFNEHSIGNGIRPEVFRAAIAVTARDCGRDGAYPIDRAALDCVLPRERSGRMAADLSGRMAAAGLDSSELYGPDVFGAPPSMPNLRQLRGTVLFWGGDEASLIYRRQKGRKAQPTVDMEYIAPWPLLRTVIHHGASHAVWTTGLRAFIQTYNHCLDYDP